MVIKKPDQRIEHDAFGALSIPAGAYWGIQTARAKELAPGDGSKPHAKLVDALVLIKKAAALSNSELNMLDAGLAKVIAQVVDEILAGQWRDQFVVCPVTGGGAKSLNCNFNEVLANRGAEIAGESVGTYEFLHPVAHVNLNQSAQALFPSAMRLALLLASQQLDMVLTDLERLLRRKAFEFEKVIKPARIQLQESLPVTLGQEFNAYASAVERSVRRLKETNNSLLEVNLGGGEIGTGYGVSPKFGNLTVEKLNQFTGFKLRPAENMLRVTQSLADFVQVSSALKELALELVKICSDLRLIGSGPHSGLGEIVLSNRSLEGDSISGSGQKTQAANPMLLECLVMDCFQVVGNDTAIALCAQSGQLEANLTMPLVIDNLMQSIDGLKNALNQFNKRYLSGITANQDHCRKLFERSDFFISVLSGHLDDETLKALILERQKTGVDLRHLIVEKQILTKDELDRIFDYKTLTKEKCSGQAGTAGDTSQNQGRSQASNNSFQFESGIAESVVGDTHKEM